MSDQPINLRRWKKRKARDAKRTEADASAVRHGRTGAEKRREALEADRARSHVDGHRLDDDG